VGDEGIVITKHGRPVAKLIPIDSGSGAPIGALKGRLKIIGNFLSTHERWNSASAR